MRAHVDLTIDRATVTQIDGRSYFDVCDFVRSQRVEDYSYTQNEAAVRNGDEDRTGERDDVCKMVR